MTEHEELLMLRVLAAKQAQELEASKRSYKSVMKRSADRISRLTI